MAEEDVTRSRDPRLVAARVFLGNLPTEKCTKEEVEEHFARHGTILGIAMFKGFGFVQYKEIEDGKVAVQVEHGADFKGNRLDVRLASEGRRQMPSDFFHPYGRPPRPENFMMGGGRLPVGSYHAAGVRAAGYPPHGPFGQLRPAGVGQFGQQPQQFLSRPPPPTVSQLQEAQQNSMLAVAALHQQQQQQHQQSQQQLVAAVQQLPTAVPIAAAASAVVAETPAPPPKRTGDVGLERPYDCAVLVVHKECRPYAELVERRLVELNMVVDVVFLINPTRSNRTTECLAKKGLLYVVNVQNEHMEHKSVTVNILHGTPEEHRNMPLDDALQMLSRDFSSYLTKLRSGSEMPSLNFLLHLLADGRNLSQPELERITAHLKQRYEKLTAMEGKSASKKLDATAQVFEQQEQRPISEAAMGSVWPAGSTTLASLPETTGTVASSAASAAAAASSAADLQQKILNMLGASSAAAVNKPTAVPTSSYDGQQHAVYSQQQHVAGGNYTASSTTTASGATPTSTASSLAAAGGGSGGPVPPDLQKALANLLQNPALKGRLPNTSTLISALGTGANAGQPTAQQRQQMTQAMAAAAYFGSTTGPQQLQQQQAQQLGGHHEQGQQLPLQQQQHNMAAYYGGTMAPVGGGQQQQQPTAAALRDPRLQAQLQQQSAAAGAVSYGSAYQQHQQHKQQQQPQQNRNGAAGGLLG